MNERRHHAHPFNGDRSSPLESIPTGSRKVYVADGDLRVPFREVTLGGDQPPVRLYDTSGPQGHAVTDGIPAQRGPWIARRRARGDRNYSQMHCARNGEITEE